MQRQRRKSETVAQFCDDNGMMKAPSANILTYILVWISLLIPLVNGYYNGESVDTIVYSQTGRSDSLKAQRPQFGRDSSARFDRRKIQKLSLGFEEGFHQISYIDTTNLGRIRVSFVYSKSGAGAIHSVSAEPVMKNTHEQYSSTEIEVDYIWVEEEPVDIQSGSVIMFAATLFVSIMFLLQACGLSDGEGATSINPNDTDGATGSWNPHSE